MTEKFESLETRAIIRYTVLYVLSNVWFVTRE